MKALGNKGEELAARHLAALGYRILKRNYRTPSGEIDIIAEDSGTVVFVEVKARGGDLFGRPEEAVDGRKRRKLHSAALSYLSGQKGERKARFDIVSVQMKGDRAEVEHIKDAFETAPWGRGGG